MYNKWSNNLKRLSLSSKLSSKKILNVFVKFIDVFLLHVLNIAFFCGKKSKKNENCSFCAWCVSIKVVSCMLYNAKISYLWPPMISWTLKTHGKNPKVLKFVHPQGMDMNMIFKPPSKRFKKYFWVFLVLKDHVHIHSLRVYEL